MERKPLLRRFTSISETSLEVSDLQGISYRFQQLSLVQRTGCLRVTHPCATLISCASTTVRVRLACVKPAANVRSEPGSNSPLEEFNRVLYSELLINYLKIKIKTLIWFFCSSIYYSVFKVRRYPCSRQPQPNGLLIYVFFSRCQLFIHFYSLFFSFFLTSCFYRKIIS